MYVLEQRPLVRGVEGAQSVRGGEFQREDAAAGDEAEAPLRCIHRQPVVAAHLLGQLARLAQAGGRGGSRERAASPPGVVLRRLVEPFLCVTD